MTNTPSNTVAPIAHVELRPIFDFGDHCVVSSIYDADYFGAYAAPSGEPACRDECFDEAYETLDYIFNDVKFADARFWYNGNEICVEIASKDDVFLVLAEVYCSCDGEFVDLGEKLGFDAAKIAELTATVRETQA